MLSSKNSELMVHFVLSFAMLDELWADRTLDPIAWELAAGESYELGRKTWWPAKQRTDPSYLQPLHAAVPTRFPSLYESLVLHFLWADVDLRLFTLFANPKAGDLKLLLGRIATDQHFWNHLIHAGYTPVGRGQTGITTQSASRSIRADRTAIFGSSELTMTRFFALTARGCLKACPSFRELVFLKQSRWPNAPLKRTLNLRRLHGRCRPRLCA
jgi:hypothetical protein